MRKFFLLIVISFLALILSACASGKITLVTPNEEKNLQNHEEIIVDVTGIDFGSMHFSCNQPELGPLSTDVVWQKQFVVVHDRVGYEILVSGNPGQLSKEISVRKGGSEIFRTTYDATLGSEVFAQTSSYGSLLTNFAGINDLGDMIRKVAKTWDKISSSYYCSSK